MIIVGLTGSIGMGKTFTAQQFMALGARVFDADLEAHKLLEKGGEAMIEVAKQFPEAVVGGAIDRTKLGDVVFNNPEKLRLLESILHPLIRKKAEQFLRLTAAQKKKFAVLDVPLLFEAGFDDLCDTIVVVEASAEKQRQRVMARKGMDDEKYRAIVALQLPNREKQLRADYTINTSVNKREVMQQINTIMKHISDRTGAAWRPRAA